LVTVAVLAWSAQGVNLNLRELIRGLPWVADLVSRMVPPNWEFLPRLGRPVLETIQIALWGTLLSMSLALPLGLLAARNLSPNLPLYHLTRQALNLLRGINEFVFALIFVAAVGLGPFAGVLSLAIHGAGLLGKFYADAIEEIDAGPVEALRATGARPLQPPFPGGSPLPRLPTDARLRIPAPGSKMDPVLRHPLFPGDPSPMPALTTHLTIIRHAWAEDPGPGVDDFHRRLTKPGRKRFEKFVRRLEKVGLGFDLIATSPLIRCRETAETLAAEVGAGTPIAIVDALAPGSDWQALVEWTISQDAARVAWVGMLRAKPAAMPVRCARAAFSRKTPTQVACSIEVPQKVMPWLAMSTA
jgi:hypothetical protein